ncbi:NDR1/HIN1-like protein 13 [Cicer arietinum]|uniref:NDR1/HIN1-like protein 13 n=1 Tax=Cicer arietinum TaxID=3827 RepID=A0A1S2Y7K3_CICAR|nr:NDR1/HIN1-like protein 13 [Cicer arietinum]
MEERASLPPPPPPQGYSDNDDNSKPKLPDIGPGTYVVQVPKDQIYRVPPPENARIAELHRSSPAKETNRSHCWCFVFIIIFLVVVIIIGGLLGGLFSIVLTPKDPRFSIQHFLLHSKPHPQYKITLEVHNPNSNVGILYKEGGDVSLSLKRQKIASSAYPTFSQDRHNSTEFEITLKSSTSKLPKEVEESMTNDKKRVHVTFSLSIHVQAKMKLGLLHSGSMKYDVSCQVKVDTLAQSTHVVSQQCQTKRH